ncbi:MAG: isocitrate lyase/phosphoenolpyruvate mutase family protein [Vicinamibacterales bacterium]
MAGLPSLFLGSSRAAESQALPDWGLLSLGEQSEYFGRIASNVGIPAVADIDVNGDIVTFYRSVKQFEQGNVAALHFGDAVMSGGAQTGMHPVATTVDRIRAVRDASPAMVVSVRCQGFRTEGFDRTLERAAAYVAAGAETVWLLPEPPRDRLQMVSGMLRVPVTSQFGFDTPTARARDWNVTVVLHDLVGRLHALWYEAMGELKSTGASVQSTRGGTLALPPDVRDRMRNVQALTDIAERMGK